MGRTFRCAALRNANDVVSTDLLEGHGAADGLRGPTLDEFGTVGSGGAKSLRSTMVLVKKTPDSLTRWLLDNTYGVWVECDKMNLLIIHRIRSFPSHPCRNSSLQAIIKIHNM